MAPKRDGRLVTAGKVTGANANGSGASENMSIARHLPNGTLDPSFGRGGLVHFDAEAGSDEVLAPRLLSDNSLIAAGSLSSSSHADFGILKLRADRSRDMSFGAPDIGSARQGVVRLDVAGVNFHDNALRWTCSAMAASGLPARRPYSMTDSTHGPGVGSGRLHSGRQARRDVRRW